MFLFRNYEQVVKLKNLQWIEYTALNNKLTENWFARTGLSSHILGKNCQRRNSPL